MSLRIVPEVVRPQTFSHTTDASSAPSVPGLQDRLRAGTSPALGAHTAEDVAGVVSKHPLEARLKQWEATQRETRRTVLRHTHGMAAAIRRELELQAVRGSDWRPAVLGGLRPSVHEDILLGRDDSIGWDDVFTGEDMHNVIGFHDEMERKFGI